MLRSIYIRSERFIKIDRAVLGNMIKTVRKKKPKNTNEVFLYITFIKTDGLGSFLRK